MDFRRGQLDERRRRVLMDEIASPPPAADSPEAQPAPAGSAKGPVRAYSSAVLADRQPKVTDFVPVRPFAAIILVLLGLTGVAAIETIHIYLQTLASGPPPELLAALDVSRTGSLAAWFSSLLLALGAVGALVIFGVRAHRVDDYRGRYRIWLWTAAALGWASLDATTQMHGALGFGVSVFALQQLGGPSAAAAVTMGWLAVYALLLGTLAIRVAIEICPSLPSLSALSVAGVLYLVAGLMQLGLFSAAAPLVHSIAASTITLLAHLGIASAVMLYARHVVLDAQGRLKVHIDPDRRKGKKPKSRAKLKVVKADKSDDDSTVSAPASTKTAPAASEPAKPAAQPRFGWGGGGAANAPAKASAAVSKSSAPYDADDDEEDENEMDGQKLSRAERKRLKKLARRDQRRAA